MKTCLSHPSAVSAEAPAAASLDPHADAPRVASSAPAGLPNRLSSREDVIACLDRIIEFYDRTEPASPVPYLARRMRRMVPMDFIELMEDLAPSGLKEFRALAGLEDDRKGSARTQGEKT
jgi:type VI secretion system protein ImpA